MTRAEVVAQARSQLGVKFLHQGRLRDVALDCVGLLLVVGIAVNSPQALTALRDPDLRGYGRLPDEAKLFAATDRYLDRITPDNMGLGDVPVMSFSGQAAHFGIVTSVDPLYIIHTYATLHKVTEHRVDDVWLSRIVRVYRFRGLAD